MAMKKVLILAYDFPPYISVGGLRPYNWLKYLKQFDVEPVIITRQWANKYGNESDYVAPSESKEVIIDASEYGTIIRAPYRPNLANRLLLKYGADRFRFIRKVITAFYEYFQFILPIGTKHNLLIEANKYLENNSVDVIIATGDPFVLFKYAKGLSTKHKTPWIADYRDLWSQDISVHKKLLFKRWCRFFEKRIVKKASHVIVVSEYLKHQISSITEQCHFEIIPNGYNKELIDNLSHIRQGGEVLSIALVGTIYKWNPINGFLFAVNNFVKSHGSDSIVINFYGVNNKEELNSIIEEKYPLLMDVLRIHPKIKNELLIEKLLSTNLTLLFNYYTFMGTKVYEYLGINRPILFCFTNDEEAKSLKQEHYKLKEVKGVSNTLQEDLIRDKKAGLIVKNKEHLIEVLEDCYSEFRQKGYVSSNTKNSDEFSRRNQAK